MQIEVTAQRLLDAQGASFEVIEPEKVGKKGYTSSGQLSAQACSIERPVDVPAGGIHPTLADVRTGTRFSVQCCVLQCAVYSLLTFLHALLRVDTCGACVLFPSLILYCAR